MGEHRRATRVPLQVIVDLHRTDWEQHVTGDISRRGMFVRMVGPTHVGQLLQLRLRLPGDDPPLSVLAKVTRRRDVSEALTQGQLPGMGIEFYCLDRTTRERWERFVETVAPVRRPGTVQLAASSSP